MRAAILMAFVLLAGTAEASTYMRVDITGSVDTASSSYSGSLDVAPGDAFSVTGYFDMSVPPTPSSAVGKNNFLGIGVAMFANLGGYRITYGTPVAPVPASMRTTYGNSTVYDFDTSSSSPSGIGFQLSATSRGLLNGFSPYYVAVSAQDHDSVGLGDLLFTADKFTAGNLAGMEETRVDFSLHNGSTVLRFEGAIDSWSARYVDAVPSAVPLPGSGVLLVAPFAGGAAMRRRGKRVLAVGRAA